jgi:hypothetical protein
LVRAASEAAPALRDAHLRFVRRLLYPFRALAFWAATLLPPVYLPLLAFGIQQDAPLAFVSLLALNALAFVAGHSHNRPAETPARDDPLLS